MVAEKELSETTINKRAGRDAELREKLKATQDRYEEVFGKPLSLIALKDFLDDSEKQNKFNFLRDRLGVLSDLDVSYLRNVLKENVVNKTVPASNESPDLDDVNLDEDGDEDESEEDFG